MKRQNLLSVPAIVQYAMQAENLEKLQPNSKKEQLIVERRLVGVAKGDVTPIRPINTVDGISRCSVFTLSLIHI